jgi:hypothetical protein
MVLEFLSGAGWWNASTKLEAVAQALLDVAVVNPGGCRIRARR